MNSSKLALKRARPALGTILLMRLEAPAEMNEAVIDEMLGRAFELAEELEFKFSKFREASDVSRLNQVSVGREIPVSAEFIDLMNLALSVWRESRGAFAPFGDLQASPYELSSDRSTHFARKTAEATLDLSGIAKGFIVDRVCEFIMREIPELSGVLNAGGDLRFFNTEERVADVRLAGGTEARRLEIGRDAIASSAMSEFLNTETSTTVYRKSPRAGLDETHVVSAIASTCAIADAMTKVGWFADVKSLMNCAEYFGARVLIFDGHGREQIANSTAP